jgi:hypothetical protein
LEHDNGIFLEIAHIDGGALDEDVVVFSKHQPTNVGEEEASFRIVGIGISFRKFVVNPWKQKKN